MKKTILKISAKCNDMYSHQLHKKDGTIVYYDGYVPSFVPNEYGDYLTLDIDPYTGKILNWKNWKKGTTRKVK